MDLPPAFAPMQSAPYFDTTEFEDEQTFYSVNIYRGPKTQVAIVYGVAKAGKAGAARALELSLESFGAEQEAGRRRAAFNRGSPFSTTPEHVSDANQYGISR